MSTAHTPSQASQIAGVSRSTVSRAIKNGKLQARKGNQGWQIEDEDLHKWMDDHQAVQRTRAAHVHDHPDTVRAAALESENQILRERGAILETENRMLRERGEELKAERDDWRAQAARRWWDFLKQRR